MLKEEGRTGRGGESGRGEREGGKTTEETWSAEIFRVEMDGEKMLTGWIECGVGVVVDGEKARGRDSTGKGRPLG